MQFSEANEVSLDDYGADALVPPGRAASSAYTPRASRGAEWGNYGNWEAAAGVGPGSQLDGSGTGRGQGG